MFVHKTCANARKRILIDSSVWVSYFKKDTNYFDAKAIMDSILKDNYLIILPTIVLVEVINCLYRLQSSAKEISLAYSYLMENKIIHLCHTTGNFWIKEIIQLNKFAHLRSHDLIIVAHALKFNAELYSFDKKMIMAYKTIKDLIC